MSEQVWTDTKSAAVDRAAELLLELDAARLARALRHLEAHQLRELVRVLERAGEE